MATDTILSFETAMEKFDPVLGFEVHVELNTKTKMFSSAPNVFGDDPNTDVNEVDLGMPGVLPVVNRAAVECAIGQRLERHRRAGKVGMALAQHLVGFRRLGLRLRGPGQGRGAVGLWNTARQKRCQNGRIFMA